MIYANDISNNNGNGNDRNNTNYIDNDPITDTNGKISYLGNIGTVMLIMMADGKEKNNKRY